MVRARRSFATVTAGAATPEELESLFEDAFVVRDGPALCCLFDDGGVLVFGDRELRGGAEIGRAAARLWREGRTYVGGPRRVLQARDTGLVVGSAGVHVMRQAGDGSWRMAISLLHTTTTPRQEKT